MGDANVGVEVVDVRGVEGKPFDSEFFSINLGTLDGGIPSSLSAFISISAESLSFNSVLTLLSSSFCFSFFSLVFALINSSEGRNGALHEFIKFVIVLQSILKG